MREALAWCNRYPDHDAAELRERLAALHGLSPQQVLVAAGLTDLLGIASRVLLKQGLNAVSGDRSFIVYPIAVKLAGAELIQVPMRQDAFDLDAIRAALNDKTRIVFLANPNNPTGTLFEAEATDEFLRQVPAHVTVILDEAYYDYAQHFAVRRGIDYSHSLEYVRNHKNVLVLRTFSKVHGLAGVRIGYAMGRPDLLNRLAQAQSTFAVSGPAQAGALAALDDHEHIERAVRGNFDGVAFISEELARLGYSIQATWGNFIYCELKENAAAFAQSMKQEGILIRPLGSWGAPSAIRVTIGTPEENSLFVRAFRTVIERE